ncbi:MULTISPECIES: DUF6415 family natural product biosynthesis protein [Streptomyces]|uniref:DUF6415 family natural product biosynthesis protein n=1 Tax=Streptomyces TaxID=1883 RepID=UPI00226E8A05|nr:MULTISPECIES: DUF6415 family natural product biosynthesis protein [unclassified Streptomyces]MCY0947363.1 DUF6415 family natural product biosynthesis protein [Streptomyces sp. H34-AA3]MCY0954662.1 DUF6415 family natural product biosynthesis protein [Streptomyces sp. H27-S2]MCZ4086466.1 DUF6415 family natural product biosynthesis protein [Streptomyces sp. H34-S5]
MSASAKAGAFLVQDADDPAAAAAPLDVAVIGESITIVLAPYEDLPPAPLRRLWFLWLSGHLGLLMPLAVRPGQRTDTATLEDTRRVLADGLPDDGPAAYVQLQELARTCRFFLGLATDRPTAAR